MASRNGLNPKIRGPKGIGFGRALPAPFGFGNGIKPDGNNDYMTVPSLVGSAFPQKATIEFWSYKDATNSNSAYVFSIVDTSGNRINANLSGTSRQQRADSNAVAAYNYFWPSSDDGLKTHMAIVTDTNDTDGTNVGSYTFYVDSMQVYKVYGINSSMPINIETFFLFKYSGGGFNSNYPMDEFRFYKTALRPDQVLLNYNSRIGANPCETENLLVWYQFEKFETLDFSILQDGSDMRLGMRDMSGKNNHGEPFNMDTNPSSPTYVLSQF